MVEKNFIKDNQKRETYILKYWLLDYLVEKNLLKLFYNYSGIFKWKEVVFWFT
jgi:hypothetical protein